jgi:DNA polymerase III alpha subunit
MAFLSMADFTGKGECIVFSDTFKQYAHLLAPESMVMVTGKSDPNGDILRVVASEFVPVEKLRETYAKKIVFVLKDGETDASTVSELKKICERHRGKFPCQFDLRGAGSSGPVRYRSSNVGVSLTDDFLDAVADLIGPESVRLSQ